MAVMCCLPPTDLMPVAEYEERLDIARVVEAAGRPYVKSLNAAEFSALMIAPIDHLRTLLRADHARRARRALRDVQGLLEAWRSACRSGSAISPLSPLDMTRSISSQSQPLSRSGVARSNSSQPQHRCNATQRDDALERDNHQCIITGTSRPHVCHIVPFSRTESQNDCDTMGLLMMEPIELFWNEDNLPMDAWEALWRAPGSADESWNMLCLSPQLHVWWADSLFGLEYMGGLTGKDKKAAPILSIQLRFHWLQKNRASKPWTPINLDDESNYASCFLSRYYDVGAEPYTGTHFFTSGHRVRTGHLFYVCVPVVDAEKFVVAIKTQWALTRVAAMCGFAETADANDDAQLAPNARISEWLRGVPSEHNMPRDPEPKTDKRPID